MGGRERGSELESRSGAGRHPPLEPCYPASADHPVLLLSPQCKEGSREEAKGAEGPRFNFLTSIYALTGTIQRGLQMDYMVCKIKTEFSAMKMGSDNKEMERRAMF